MSAGLMGGKKFDLFSLLTVLVGIQNYYKIQKINLVYVFPGRGLNLPPLSLRFLDFSQ